MKISRSLAPVGLALIIAATSMGYSAHMAAHVRNVERRLQHAEALLQSHSHLLANTTSAERVRRLEARVQRAELVGSQGQLAAASAGPGLEKRIQNVEQQITPHLEELPPYVPTR